MSSRRINKTKCDCSLSGREDDLDELTWCLFSHFSLYCIRPSGPCLHMQLFL